MCECVYAQYADFIKDGPKRERAMSLFQKLVLVGKNSLGAYNQELLMCEVRECVNLCVCVCVCVCH